MIIEIDDFLDNFRDQFDEIEPQNLRKDTLFKELEEWSSMHALLVIAMIDASYDVSFTGDELQACTTVGDIYDIVVAKKNKL